jgi:hypothetical protein
MKKTILTVALLLAFGYFAAAQQVGKTKHLMISIVEYPNSAIIGHPTNIYVTRDDTAQTRQYINLKLHVKAKDYVAAHEAQIMELLKPYYNSGWKLATTSVEVISSTGGATETTRYFFTKEE